MHNALAFVLTVPLLAFAPTHGSARVEVERIVVNDNRTPAGTLRGGVLTIRLEARKGEWHPDSDHDPGLVVHAFAEQGKSPSVPGPLIRVPEGTEIHAFVTNTLAQPLVMRGLGTRGIATSADTIQIAPGATRSVCFPVGPPGTYYYRGVTAAPSDTGVTVDAELHGAFIVDSAGTPARASDRVFVIGLWSSRALPGGLVLPNVVLRFTINGKAWPNSERLSYALGDTVHFRVINASVAVHPMHLHGFYFDVDSRGSGLVDSVYSNATAPYRVVTERSVPGRTFTMTWIPVRAGNWLFHCHDNYHVLRNAPLNGTPLPAEQHVHTTNHARDMMGGLVMGIEVRGREDPRVRVAESARRKLRLVAQSLSGGTDSEPSYGFTLHEGAEPATSNPRLLPGPIILLKRGEPVGITIVNHVPEATAVHWHGIELESYFDGVADFSGNGAHVMHAIAPNDSFEARFTPPRSGTFMYHPHADELRQQQAGLTGALLVVDDPARFDPTHDIVLLLTVPRLNADGNNSIYINGSLTPPPLELRTGDRYRLRLVDVHTFRPSMIARVLRDSSLVTWRAIAKDGMDLPPARATVRPSIQQMGNGETYDFEFAPTGPGNLKLTVTSAANQQLAALTIRVR